ncbi:MAG: O-antigen ligase family protein [bacterium]
MEYNLLLKKLTILNWFYFAGFCLILSLPLLNLPPWFSPPNWGKVIVFRILFSVLIFVFLWSVFSRNSAKQIFWQKTNALKKSLSFKLLLSLLGIYFLATLFSQDIYFSFWGSPYRGGGFLNFALYIFLAIFAYLVLRKNDWPKLWNFTFFIGVLISTIAILQQHGLFNEIIIKQITQPMSTLGNSTFLAAYLLLLCFLILAFGIKNKNYYAKFFYFSCLGLFIFTIAITVSRAAYIGLLIGSLYFVFFYPTLPNLKKKVFLMKFVAGIFLVLSLLGIYWFNSQPEFPKFIKENYVLNNAVGRFFPIEKALPYSFQERLSGWKVAMEALKDKPIIGYGPENFSIGFDKYYDSSAPYITKFKPYLTSGTGWWDRAHNFVFDIGVTAGIPALIIYLSLFTVLFYQLQKVKRKCPDKAIICHGIQATFLAYLAANFFSFDSFSSYIILFLLIGYCLHLISSANPETQAEIQEVGPPALIAIVGQNKYGIPLLVLLFIAIAWFIWVYNLKPLQINKDINMAVYWQSQGDCEKALSLMDKVLSTSSYVDSYARLKYADIVNYCLQKEEDPKQKIELVEKAIKAMEENATIRPTYTRNWWFLGGYGNYLIDIANRADLKEKTNYYFRQANALSPKRQEILRDWIKTDLLTEEYLLAKEKAQQCLEIDPSFAECWWLKGLAQINLKETAEAKEDIDKARQTGYGTETAAALSQIITAYAKIEDYPNLIEVYQKIILLEPANFQHYASLAYCYKMTENYEEARKAAQRVIELSPESKDSVEEFLSTLIDTD